MNTTTTTNQDFLISSKAIDFFIAAINWACWKFLAITTAVLSYQLTASFLQAHLPPQYLFWGQIIGITLIFLLVDAGLQNMLAYYLKEKSRLSKSDKAKKAFLKSVFWLLFFRIILTATSSWWAAPAASKFITTDNQANNYTSQIANLDQKDSIEYATASTLLATAQKNESQRIASAKSKAEAEKRKQINSGDQWQIDSYRREGFSWICNKANPDKKDRDYCNRIKTAISEGKAAIEAEKQKVSLLESKLLGRSNPTRDSTKTALLALATSANDQYLSELSTNTNIIYIFDIAAVLLGILCTRLRVKRRIVAADYGENKSFLFTIGRAIEKAKIAAINKLEEILEVDIDGNGVIGEPESDPPTPPSTPTKRLTFKEWQEINNSVQNSNKNVIPIDISQRNEVATSSYDSETEIQYIIGALKDANSNLTAWQSKPDSCETKEENINKYTNVIKKAEEDLIRKGINPKDVLKKRKSRA